MRRTLLALATVFVFTTAAQAATTSPDDLIEWLRFSGLLQSQTAVAIDEPIHPAQPTPRTTKHTGKGTEQSEFVDGWLKRKPGAYRTAGHVATCWMCLGQHLRNTHRQSYEYVDKLGYKNWAALHDNLHNSRPAPKPSPG